MTDQADRAIVDAIKRREANLLCRTCGHRIEVDTGYCNFCGRMNPAINRPPSPHPGGSRDGGQEDT